MTPTRTSNRPEPFLKWLLLCILIAGPTGCDASGGPNRSDAGDIAAETRSDAMEPSCEEGSWKVHSPDSSLTVEFRIEDRGGTADYPTERTLYYRIVRNGARVLGWSPLGIETSSSSWRTISCVDAGDGKRVSEDYQMQVGKRERRQFQARRRRFGLYNDSDERLDLIVEVHNDGLGYRYRLGGAGDYEVVSEASGFAIPEDATGWMAPYDLQTGLLAGSYEGDYRSVSVGEEAPESGWAYPGLFELRDGDQWLLVTEADLNGEYAATRLHQEPVDGVYRVRLPAEHEGNGVGWVQPRGERPLRTPWRVLIVGELSQVVESTLVDDLSRPSRIEKTGWVKPGRVAWSWFTQGTGEPSLQRDYIAFADRMGWEYVLIDARWDQWSDPNSQIPKLVREASSRDVGILLWYNSGGEHASKQSATPTGRMLDGETRRAEMKKLSEWGVDGIKVDFFDSDKQDRIRQYIDILEDAADYELLVNFHGCTLPRGWQRTYPHLMTHEAVRGVEYYGFGSGPSADDHVEYVFTRNVVGSMDYTPVVFGAALDKQQISYSHSLAEAVVFESGLQHFADRADGSTMEGYGKVFAASPEIEDFLSRVPVTWDETRLLEGHPSSHAVLARRSGSSWYIAGLNGSKGEKQVSVPLNFAKKKTYEQTCFTTGAKPTKFETQTTTVQGSDQLEVTMTPSDGFVCVLTPPQ